MECLNIFSLGFVVSEKIFCYCWTRKSCNVFAFTLCCFLAKFVRLLLKLVGYIKEKIQDVQSQNVFLRMVFICSMEYLVCFCAASLVVSKETKWRYDRVEKAACIVGHVRDCVCCSLVKAMLPLEEINFGVTVSFVHLVERRALSPLKWPTGELRARCRERNKGITST